MANNKFFSIIITIILIINMIINICILVIVRNNNDINSGTTAITPMTQVDMRD